MSAARYLQQSVNRTKAAPDAADFDEPEPASSPSPPAGSFRRTRSTPSQNMSVAGTASVAANAKKFVNNFRARRGGAGGAARRFYSDDDEDGDAPQPTRFNPAQATGSKGFVGAVANHLSDAEKRRQRLRAENSHNLAVNGVYKREVALHPTQAPAGAPRFYHTLPVSMPQVYFVELAAKQEQAQLGTSGAASPKGAASPTRHDGTDDLEAMRSAQRDAFSAVPESSEVMRDLVTGLKAAHSRGIYNKAMFVANERVQSLKDVPLKEMAQGDFLWRTWRKAVDEFVTFHATTALNGRYLLGSGKNRYVAVGSSSVVDLLEGVLIHVWRSPAAAREFIAGWRRAWRAVFESRLEGITCPLSAGYRIQGSFVTVTALCPLEPTFAKYIVELSPASIWGSHGIACPGVAAPVANLSPDQAEHVQVESPALKTMVRRLCHALCIDAPPPLTLGLDGRYYILDLRNVLQPTFGDASIPQRPRLELLLQMRDLRALIGDDGYVVQLPPHVDRYAEEETGIREKMTASVLTQPLTFMKRVGVRRCLIDMLRTLVQLDYDAPVTAESILDKNLISQLCHRSGVNLCFLPLLIEEALTADIPDSIVDELTRGRLSVAIAEACKVEMLTRTLKDLAALDLGFGTTASTPLYDVGRRIHVPNRVASLAIAKDEIFYNDHVYPRMRVKFHGCSTGFTVDPSTTSAGRLVRNLIFHLGVELCSDQKRFTHFCPIAQTYAMVMRPPATAEMYLQKQYSDLDVEVPALWARWRMTPTTSPVRHSAFVQAAFLTLLCRAPEKYEMVRDAADDCAPDFDDDDLLQAEIMGIAAEAALISEREERQLRAYLAALRNLTRDGHFDSPVFAGKFLNAALLCSRCNLAIQAANSLVRIERASAGHYSATFRFASSSAEAMLVHEQDEQCLLDYLAMQREAIKQARAVSVKEAVHTALHCTAVLVAAHEGSAAYSSEAVVEFAREALRLEMEGLGPRNRCTCVGLYHVMVVALRERAMTENSAVKRHLGLSERVLDMLLKEPDTKKIPGMTHSQRSMELIERVVRVLREAGDRKSSVLIRQARESIIKGEIVDAIEEENDSNDSGEAIANKRATSPSMVLSDSDHRPVEMNDSDDDSKLEASLHSPSERRESNASDAVLSRKQSAVAADKVVAPAALHPVSDDEEDKREAVAA